MNVFLSINMCSSWNYLVNNIICKLCQVINIMSCFRSVKCAHLLFNSAWYSRSSTDISKDIYDKIKFLSLLTSGKKLPKQMFYLQLHKLQVSEHIRSHEIDSISSMYKKHKYNFCIFITRKHKLEQKNVFSKLNLTWT